MPKKKLIKKHSVKANLHVVELTRAGSSLDLAIYADNEKIGTMIIGSGSPFGTAENDSCESAFRGVGLRR
jgi:hypothetical protein